mgnify:CR=1 FL=1
MAYEINLKLNDNWKTNLETYTDEVGETTHLEAHLPGDSGDPDQILIDIYVGDLPDGETAEDQAFANYAEVIGFDEEDENEESPIVKFKFNGKNAWGFEALCEDDSPMRFLAQEVRSGVLAIIVFAGKDDRTIIEVQNLIERSFRVAK